MSRDELLELVRDLRDAQATQTTPDGDDVTPRQLHEHVIPVLRTLQGRAGPGHPPQLDQMFSALLDSSDDLIFSVDADGIVSYWNRGAERVLGHAPGRIVGRSELTLVPDDHRSETDLLYRRVLSGERVARFETVRLHDTGERVHLSLNLTPLRGSAGEVSGIAVIGRDITDRVRAERALRQSERQLESILNNAAEGMIVLSENGTLERINLVAQRLFGLDADESTGMNLRQLAIDLTADDARSALDNGTWLRTLLGGRRELSGRRSDGALFPLELSLSEISLDPYPPKFTAVLRDITERKRWETQIYALAYSDPLTGLPNRLLLRDRLEHAIAAAQRNRSLVAVLFVDLDDFKYVNDSFGHHVGDQLLRDIADRARSCVREIDTVCRVGGDEFVVVLPELHDAQDAGAVARKLLTCLAQPYRVDVHDMRVTPTLGISVFPHHGSDAETLLRNADAAMYHAKENGKNAFRFYGD